MNILKSEKKKGNDYFDADTEKAIVDFQKAETLAEKEKVYYAQIHYSFSKLIENIIFVYKFQHIDDLQSLKNDCLSFLFETLYKFDSSKGHKAFSYFNVVAKHWFIQRIKNKTKKTKTDVELDNEVISHIESKIVDDGIEAAAVQMEFFEYLKKELKKWNLKYEKQQEKILLESIIFLLENPEVLPLYNKKATFLYLREMTNLNTKQIFTNLNKFKKKYSNYKRKYFSGDM